MAALPNDLPEMKVPRIRKNALLRIAAKRHATLDIQRCPVSPEYEQEIVITAHDSERYTTETVYRIVTYPEVGARAYAAWEAALNEILKLWIDAREGILSTGQYREMIEGFAVMRREWRVDDRLKEVTDHIIAGAVVIADLPGRPMLLTGMTNAIGQAISVLAYCDGGNEGQRRHVDLMLVEQSDDHANTTHYTATNGRTHQQILRRAVEAYAHDTARHLVMEEERAGQGSAMLPTNAAAERFVSEVVDEAMSAVSPLTFDNLLAAYRATGETPGVFTDMVRPGSLIRRGG